VGVKLADTNKNSQPNQALAPKLLHNDSEEGYTLPLAVAIFQEQVLFYVFRLLSSVIIQT
jgi:hypothetical protein